MTETNYLIITQNFWNKRAKLIILCKHDIINNEFWENLTVFTSYKLGTQGHAR
jgi:hypothetical protein